MGKENWILLRGYAPAVALFGVALLMMLLFGGLPAGPLPTKPIDMLRWAPVAIAGGSFLQFGVISYRLRRWERGDGLCCITCGGPLGHERKGHTDRGGAFRRCYACGKAVNHRHYD
jgi:hypothetical protein